MCICVSNLICFIEHVQECKYAALVSSRNFFPRLSPFLRPAYNWLHPAFTVPPALLLVNLLLCFTVVYSLWDYLWIALCSQNVHVKVIIKQKSCKITTLEEEIKIVNKLRGGSNVATVGLIYCWRFYFPFIFYFNAYLWTDISLQFVDSVAHSCPDDVVWYPVLTTWRLIIILDISNSLNTCRSGIIYFNFVFNLNLTCVHTRFSSSLVSTSTCTHLNTVLISATPFYFYTLLSS